jgi:membrane fusion protein (multidrug efflux system)
MPHCFVRVADHAIRPTVLFAVLVLISAVAGCNESGARARTAEQPRVTAVSIAPVVARDVPVTIDATGSFAAAESSDVASEVSGRIVATPVDIGARVERGDVLVRLQGVDARLRLDEAEAAVRRAQANVSLAESQNTLAQSTAERYTNLLATGDVSRTVADQARTQAETQQQTVATAHASLAEAQAQLALAQKALGDVVVTAPFPGFITTRHVAVGEYVQPMNPIVTLVEIDPIRLQLTIPGVQAGRVAVGQAVTATVDAFPGRTFTGTLTAVSPAIDPQSRSFTVEARVRNPDALLKPGMFAVATIDQGRRERAFFVPRAAVSEDINTDSFRVFVVDDKNIAHLRVVQPAPRSEGEQIRLTEGVAEGERVATTNLGDLYEGAPVTMTGAPEALASGGTSR